jgi:hypothetical protein
MQAKQRQQMIKWLAGRAPRLGVLALLLATGGAFATFGIVSGQGGPTVSIESGEIPEGGSGVSRLSALDVSNPPLCAITVDVKYDRTVNLATACDADPEGRLVLADCSADYAWDTVRVTAASINGVTGDIPLMDITWCALGSAGESTDLDVQIVSFQDCAIPPADIPVGDQDGVNVIVTGSPPVDTDGDGFGDCVETYLSADPLDDCPDDASDHAWPPDINNDTKANILDVLLFKRRLNCSVGDGCYNNRFDLNIDGEVNILDALMYKWMIGMECTP